MSYPRRIQLLYTAGAWAMYAAAVAAMAELPVAAARSASAVLALLGLGAALLAGGLVFRQRAARYRVGADSENLVAERLKALERRGWKVRHSVVWRGRGDIDHVVRAPGGLEFAIETKTGRYAPEHLVRTRAAAAHVDPRGRSCVPVICLARPHGVSFADRGVQIVSADLLATRLGELAGLR